MSIFHYSNTQVDHLHHEANPDTVGVGTTITWCVLQLEQRWPAQHSTARGSSSSSSSGSSEQGQQQEQLEQHWHWPAQHSAARSITGQLAFRWDA
jgi:hypothetical protein